MISEIIRDYVNVSRVSLQQRVSATDDPIREMFR